MEVKVNYELLYNPIEYKGFKIRFEPWVTKPSNGVKLEAQIDSTINLLGCLGELGSVNFSSSVNEMIECWSETLSDDDLWEFLTKASRFKVKGRTYVEWVEYPQDMKEQTGCNGYARVVGFQFNGEPDIERIDCVNDLKDAKEKILRMVNTVREFKLKPHVRAGEVVAYRRLAFDPNKKHELMVVPANYPEDKVVGVIAQHKFFLREHRNWKGMAGMQFGHDLEKYNETLNKYWEWRYVVIPPEYMWIPPDLLPNYHRMGFKNPMPITDEQLEQEIPNIFNIIDEIVKRNQEYNNNKINN